MPPSHLYTLSLHDALPIFKGKSFDQAAELAGFENGLSRVVSKALDGHLALDELEHGDRVRLVAQEDRKSTRLNSSHLVISYAVFCLKKKRDLGIVLVAGST